MATNTVKRVGYRTFRKLTEDRLNELVTILKTLDNDLFWRDVHGALQHDPLRYGLTAQGVAAFDRAHYKVGGGSSGRLKDHIVTRLATEARRQGLDSTALTLIASI